MKLDYSEIGKRIARRRKELRLRQTDVSEKAGISDKYLSCIERAASIPSLEVIMRLVTVLDMTYDELLMGTFQRDENDWHDVAELLKTMNPEQLNYARCFLLWLSEQELSK